MRNKKRLLGMLALALTFGMTLAGCGSKDDDDPASNTPGASGTSETWMDEDDSYKIVITGGTWVSSSKVDNAWQEDRKGTCSKSDATITFTATHEKEGNDWVASSGTITGTISGNTLRTDVMGDFTKQ